MGLIYSGITPVALSMMLLGGYVVKKDYLSNIYGQLMEIKPYLLAALGILLVYRFILMYWALPNFEIPHGSALSITLMTFFQLSDVVISFSLLWLIGYLWNKGLAKKILSPLRFVGRMALSNYIFQSVMGYLIMRTFDGYEYFSAFGCILLVLGIYLIQIVLSKIWLSKFQFGPLEWLWRCISYMKWLPIAKANSNGPIV